MKRLILVLSLALNTTYCTPQNKNTPQSATPTSQREVASVKTEGSENGGSALAGYPSSFILFLKNQPQRVKLDSTLKQYAGVLPKASFEKMMDLSKKVDDAGITITRENNELVLNNGTSTVKVSFGGPLEKMTTTIQGTTYDLSTQKNIDNFLKQLESNINKKAATSSSSSLFAFCDIFDFIFAPNESHAFLSNIPTGWYILGGMALIAIAIAVAANKATKNLRNTKHTIEHKVGLSDKTNTAINDLTDAVKDVNVDLSGNSINVNSDGINVDTPTSGSSLGIE